MKKIICWTILFFVSCVFTGCLISEDPFYDEKDIIFDERLLGSFPPGTNRPSWYSEKYGEYLKNGKYSDTNAYRVTLVSDVYPDCEMKFKGVLFQIGTNKFLDLVPLHDVCDHVSGTFSLLEILQGLTRQPLHMVVRVDLRSNEVNAACVDTEGLKVAMKKAPDFFEPLKGKHPGRMISNTERQREFLRRFGSDTNIFCLTGKPAKIPAKK